MEILISVVLAIVVMGAFLLFIGLLPKALGNLIDLARRQRELNRVRPNETSEPASTDEIVDTLNK
jgi:hypothetical protein